MLTYIVPKYVDGIGNVSLVRDEAGVRELNTSLNLVLRRVFEERRVDLRVVKRKASKLLNQRNLIPLYLAYNEVLVPIRIRKPMLKNDPGYGYVNLSLVKKVEEGRLIFNDGSCIEYIESIKTVKRRLKAAQKIMDKLGEVDSLKSLSEVDLSVPATKEDILILIKEVMRLKNAIEG